MSRERELRSVLFPTSTEQVQSAVTDIVHGAFGIIYYQIGERRSSIESLALTDAIGILAVGDETDIMQQFMKSQSPFDNRFAGIIGMVQNGMTQPFRWSPEHKVFGVLLVNLQKGESLSQLAKDALQRIVQVRAAKGQEFHFPPDVFHILHL